MNPHAIGIDLGKTVFHLVGLQGEQSLPPSGPYGYAGTGPQPKDSAAIVGQSCGAARVDSKLSGFKPVPYRPY